jgi:hypothetical protein
MFIEAISDLFIDINKLKEEEEPALTQKKRVLK